MNNGPPKLTLFDTGPDSSSLIRNMDALKVESRTISRVVLSHWHSDHSGGLLSFLRRRNRDGSSTASPCVVDLHPDRPLLRGIAPGPKYDKVIGALPPDPTVDDIKALGGVVEVHTDGHCVAEDTVWVSGEIPRITHFEPGILGGMRWVEDENSGGEWVAEPVSI